MTAGGPPLSTVASRSDEERSASVAAWAEDAAVAAQSIGRYAHGTAPTRHEMDLPIRPSATVTTSDPIRGTTVTLSIPLDEPVSSSRQVRPDEPVNGATRLEQRREVAYLPKKKMIRRDSLERREALLKGREGSRRRQRWENGQLLSNPWAEPPLPSDWEVRPTYPRVEVPYFLAPLWEADASKRARRQSKVARAKAKATLESRAQTLPRELREKLKRTRSARGLLVDLEVQVRNFLEDYRRKQALQTVTEDGNEEDGQVLETDEEDEEIVFVGRQGQMKDIPPSPKAKKHRRGRSPGPTASARARSGTVTSGSDDDIMEIEAGGESFSLTPEKLVFNGPAGDQGASFARWIVHSIGDYYGLKTWSVTVGNPAMREAYVGIDTMRTGRDKLLMAKSLPQPLWGMV